MPNDAAPPPLTWLEPGDPFPPVTLATKSLTAKATGPTELLAGIKGPTVTATGQFPPPPEVPGGE